MVLEDKYSLESKTEISNRWVELELGKLTDQKSDTLIKLSILQNRTVPEKGVASQVHKEIISKIRMNGNQIILASEFSYVGGEGPLSRSEHNKFLQELLEASKGANSLIVPGSFSYVDTDSVSKQVTYGIFDGKIVYQRFRGQESPMPFRLWGLEFLIETCIENGFTRGTDHKFVSEGVDILIVPACGLYFGKEKLRTRVLRNGGYAISVDGFGETLFKVVQKTENGDRYISKSILDNLSDYSSTKYKM